MTYKVVRAEELYQQAGAYYVRIEAMARKHHIPLHKEFDEHDTPDTKYIVLLDDNFPIATARIYELDKDSMMIGRVVVLPDYRHQGIGTLVIQECEKWIKDLGYTTSVLESRDNKTVFYEKCGYTIVDDTIIEGDTFNCIRMEKRV